MRAPGSTGARLPLLPYMRPSQIRNLIVLVVSLLVLGWMITTAADFIIEYNWWKEVGQASTWISMLWYSIAPAAAGALVAFIALWVAHARGLHFAGVRSAGLPPLLPPDCGGAGGRGDRVRFRLN